MAKEIKASLSSREALALKDGQAPTLESDSCECYMWAVALLASAWTEWVFKSKSNNPAYQGDPAKVEAVTNVKLALPYVKPSIADAVVKGREIGRRRETNFRPEGISAKIELRKEP